jgi:hypothetical protein
MKASVKIQYSCAVLLIVSSIALAFYQVLDIDDIASGTLMYIAQAFLLAGSIFGLNYYVNKLSILYGKKDNDNTPRHPQQ